jgi:hypothetical protein
VRTHIQKWLEENIKKHGFQLTKPKDDVVLEPKGVFSEDNKSGRSGLMEDILGGKGCT